MTERQRRWLLVPAIVLVFGWLLGAILILPGSVFSAPSAQDEILNLTYGDDLIRDAVIADPPYFDGFTYQVNVPPGAELTVWVGEDSQGGCYWNMTLYHNGIEVGEAWVGDDPNTWSDPVTAMISSGSAQVHVIADTSCMYSSDQYVARVRFKVSGSPPPEATTPPPSCQPQIEFWADRDHILRGECTALRWDVGCVNTVHYQRDGVPGEGYRQECPQQTTTYELCVKTYEGEQICQQVTVYVEEPTVPSPTIAPTSSPPPTTAPTPTPRTPTTTPAPRTPTATPTPRTPTTTPTPRTPTYTPTPRTPTPIPTSTPPPCPDRFEPNDDPQTPWQVSPGTYQSYICTPYDHDWFSVVLDETTDLQVTLTDLPADFQLMMGPQHGVPMKGSYNEGRADEHLTFEDAEPGVYLIHIFGGPGHRPVEERGYSDQEPYTLIIRVGEPPIPEPEIKLLVVTNIQALQQSVGFQDSVLGDTWTQVQTWLDERYGPEGYTLLDVGAISSTPNPGVWQIKEAIRLYWEADRYWAIFIIGGHNVVPHASILNPVQNDGLWTGDWDVFTDDSYTDFNGDGIPDYPLARLPDGGDIGLLASQINQYKSGGSTSALVMTQDKHQYAEIFARAFNQHRVIYSEDVYFQGPDVDAAFTYFALNGCSGKRNDTWCYQSDGLPFYAFKADYASSRGVVVTEASYGAAYCNWEPCDRNATSIPLAFLKSGVTAFIGTTAANFHIPARTWYGSTVVENYGVIGPGIPTFTNYFLNHWNTMANPFMAYHLAKRDTLQAAQGPSLESPMVRKMGHALVYYGVPPNLEDCAACVPPAAKVPQRFQDVGSPQALAIDVRKPLEGIGNNPAIHPCGYLDCNDPLADSDNDGLSDLLEWRLAYEFEPYLEFDVDEQSHVANPDKSNHYPIEFDVYYQVSPQEWDWLTVGNTQSEHKNPCEGGEAQISVVFIMAYSKDHGARLWSGPGGDGWFGHDGDTEPLQVQLYANFDYPTLNVCTKQYSVKRHGSYYIYTKLPSAWRGPYLRVSGNKHAMYPNYADCKAEKAAEINYERCDGGGLMGYASEFTPYLASNHNAGEAGGNDTRHWLTYTPQWNHCKLCGVPPIWTSEKQPLWEPVRFSAGVISNCPNDEIWVIPLVWKKTVPICGGPFSNKWVYDNTPANVVHKLLNDGQ